MIRIGIDCRFASGLGGLGTYTRELVIALAARAHPSWEYILFVSSLDEQWHQNIVCEKIIVPYRHYTFAEQFFLPYVYRKSKIDLLFSPHFNVPFFLHVPVVCTIHDLILHRYPNQASSFKSAVYHLVFSHAVNTSAHILTVSDSTKKDLLRTYPSRLASSVTVAYPGISPLFTPANASQIDDVRVHFDLQKPYFLYVGNAKTHKNVPILLEAFASLGLSDTEFLLVSSGSEVDRLSLPIGVRVLCNVPVETLPALYSNAIACCTASAYEGFGLPVVEAMACGCPVIATNCTSIPEISNAKALLIEPTVEAFAQALRAQLHMSVDRNALTQGWHERYKWEKTAEIASSVFANVLQSQYSL